MESVTHCPFCFGEIPEDVQVCRHCGERILGQKCAACATLCPDEATKCRWCGSRFEKTPSEMAMEEFTIKAAFPPTLLVRLRLLRESIRFTQEKLIVTTPGFFHLSVHETELPWNKVAGFLYRSGIFWDAVAIETRGQQTTVIRCLTKRDGRRVRETLRKLEI